MKSNEDYINKLYSEKFEEFEMEASTEEWLKLSTKLNKVNFFKFSWYSFNAFYLLSIIISAIAVIYLGISSLNHPENVENQLNIKKAAAKQKAYDVTKTFKADSISVKESYKNQAIKIEKTVDKASIKTEQLNESKNETMSNSGLVVTKLKKDSIIVEQASLPSINTDTLNSDKPKIVKIKRIKKTVVVKQNQVVITDTVKIKKKEK